MAMVTKPPPKAVAINTASLSIPARLSKLGANSKIYVIVIKVVSPASISVRTVVFRSFKANTRSNMVNLLVINKITSLL